MRYHGQDELEQQIDDAAASPTDGLIEFPHPVDPAVVARAKRWAAWMVDVAIETQVGWRRPTSAERAGENEIALLWEGGAKFLYVVVGEEVSYFQFEEHPLWGGGVHGSALDGEEMMVVWEELWLREVRA